MIAQPFRYYHIFGDKVFNGNRQTLLEFFIDKPAYVQQLLVGKPWFFILQDDLAYLENLVPDFKFADSTKILNKIKLEIFHCFVENLRHSIFPTASDWQYLNWFNVNYNSLLDVYIGSKYNDSLSLLGEESQRYGRLDEMFEAEPEKVENLIIFNKKLFFEKEDLDKLLALKKII